MCVTWDTEINDNIRQVLVNQPSVPNVTQMAQKTGHVSLQTNAVSLLAAGITTVQEIQRVLQK